MMSAIEDGPFKGLEQNGYAAISADPAWSFKVRSPKGEGRSPKRHYETMSLLDICALPVGDLAAKDCHLFLWTTGPGLREAFKVIDHWGFRYSAIGFVWIKLKRNVEDSGSQFSIVKPILLESNLHVGLGFTTRKNAEIVLLARRGSPKRISKNVREVILSPVREHSRKPDEMYRRVTEYCEGPYLDLFARQRREGWTSWGFEIDKFKALNIQKETAHEDTRAASP
jgi:N6-adenosine-specific RNA methylase IME4